MQITRSSVLAWRQQRQFLDPYAGADATAPAIAGRLCGAQAQVGSAADLAVALRQADPQPEPVTRALAGRALVRTWAMRGTLHAMHPAQAGAFLALIAAAGTWKRPVWQRSFVTTDQLDRLADAVREVLDGPPVSREDLVAGVGQRCRDADLIEHLRSGWGTVLKPLAWQGQLCHGPVQGNRVTFTRPDRWMKGWKGLPDTEEAARTAIPAYLGTHGPATARTFDQWLTRGATPARELKRWIAALGDEVAEVDVEGVPALARAADVDDIARAKPGKAVRLLPGFDQYVLAPGTRDETIIAADRRALVSKAAGWISPVVLAGGRVVGTWEVDGPAVSVALFGEAGTVSAAKLKAQVARVSAALGRSLTLTVTTT